MNGFRVRLLGSEEYGQNPAFGLLNGTAHANLVTWPQESNTQDS